jgi:hypothetical protein
MKNLLLNISKLSLPSIFIFSSLLFLTSCEDDDANIFQIDHLLKTWVYESFSNSTMDPTEIFELDKLLKDSEITFVQNAQKTGEGTYSTISPNNPGNITGEGIWQTNATDVITGLTLDAGTSDAEIFDVLTLNASTLHLKTDSKAAFQYEITYKAK